MAATATALIAKRIRLEKQKKELDEKLTACKAEIEKTQEGVIDWFQRSGTDRISQDGVTLYIRRELWPGRADGVTSDEACKALADVGLGDYAAPRLNTQGLRSHITELEAADTEFLSRYPGLANIIKVNEVFKIGVRSS